jgi:hypothetical protein
VEWAECSRSPECGPAAGGGDWTGVEECADSCLAARHAAREQERLARLQQESQAQLQLHYSASVAAPGHAPGPAHHLPLLVWSVSLLLPFLVRL